MRLLRQLHFFAIKMYYFIFKNVGYFTLDYNSIKTGFNFAKFANIFLAKMILTFNYRLK